LTKLVEIVGEAAKSISITGGASLPDIPWRAAARMRDRLVHHYFDINLDVLWQTISEDLPGHPGFTRSRCFRTLVERCL
jgi:uncharacterized protein with HEPN domain